MELYCTHCEVVLVTDSRSELCTGCIEDILSCLFWDDTEEQEQNDYLERMSLEFTYQSQFSLVSARIHRV